MMFRRFYKVFLRIAIALEKIADIEPKPKNSNSSVEMLEEISVEELEELEKDEGEISLKEINEKMAKNDLNSPYIEDNLTEEELEFLRSRM